MELEEDDEESVPLKDGETRRGHDPSSGSGGAGDHSSGGTKRHLASAILLAQLLSACLAVTGISSAALAAKGINIPTSQSVLNYALLAITFGASRLLQKRKSTTPQPASPDQTTLGGTTSSSTAVDGGGWRFSWPPRPLARPWWCYALLALVDVEANFLVVKAYQFTSLTSVTLLDCFTIPAVIALSSAALGARYRRRHFGAAALCVAGLAVLVLSEGRSSTGGSDPLLGDALVLLGATLYAVSNVTQELFLSSAAPSEVLCMVGAFGAPIAAVQAALLEHSAWADLLAAGPDALAGAAAALGAFTGALFLFSSLVPIALLWGGAAALNLSLLTSDLFAAAARIVWFGGFGGGGLLFATALTAVAGGLALYASAGSPGGSGGGGGGGDGSRAAAELSPCGPPPPALQWRQQQRHQEGAGAAAPDGGGGSGSAPGCEAAGGSGAGRGPQV